MPTPKETAKWVILDQGMETWPRVSDREIISFVSGWTMGTTDPPMTLADTKPIVREALDEIRKEYPLPTRNTPRVWTEDVDNELANFKAEGFSTFEIACKLTEAVSGQHIFSPGAISARLAQRHIKEKVAALKAKT